MKDITIAGHKINPLLLAGGAAAVVGLMLLRRSQAQQAPVVLGQPTTDASGLSGSDLVNALLGQEATDQGNIAALQGQLNSLQGSGGPGTTAQQLQGQTPAGTVFWHWGGSDPYTQYWEWLPAIAAEFGLPTGPQTGPAPGTPGFGAFPAGVPAAYSWAYGDVLPPGVSSGSLPPTPGSPALQPPLQPPFQPLPVTVPPLVAGAGKWGPRGILTPT